MIQPGTSAAATERGGQPAGLLARLRAQDPTVAGPLWERFAPMVFRILRRTLGPRAPVDDAVQVVLLCVFRRGLRLQPHSDLKQLVVRTTVRIALAELRPRALLWFPRPRAPRGADGATHRESEAVARFYRVLDRLSALDRIAFVLHVIEGFSVREVADAIGGSPAQARRRLARGLGQVIDGIERDPVLGPLRQSGRA